MPRGGEARPTEPALVVRTDLAPLQPPPGFVERAAEIGVAFEPGELERLGRYLAMLLDTNEAVNLTAVKDPAEAWERHILDALTVLGVLAELPEGAAVLDVGTGGGIPGVPVAICAPRLRVTLLDATRKKTLFLEQVAGALALTNVSVVTGRAETLAHDMGKKTGEGRVGGHRQAYDAVLARAVGRLATLAEITVPFATVGGLCVLIKGAKADEELAEAKAALHLLHAAHAGTVATPTGRIVVLEKLRTTPRDYPRREGEPKRAPLGVKT